MTYRISKHHPLFSKHVDDWTSLTDVGKERYNLTIEKYSDVENRYIKAVTELLALDKNEQLRISNFQEIIKWNSVSSKRYNVDKSVFELYTKDYQKRIYRELYSGKRIFSCCKLPELLKILLREEAWFVISVDDYKIDVGYDYYIHISTTKDLMKNIALLPDEIYLEEFSEYEFLN